MKNLTYRSAFRWMPGFLFLAMSTTSFADYEFKKEFGSFGSSVGQFSDPRGVAVTSGDEIVVTESGNNRVQICTDQAVCTTFGSLGIERGQFDRPRGVAVDNAGGLVVSDRGNDRIQICSTAGSCSEMGGSGTAVGKFESPRGVAVNQNGQIVVADTENNRIQVCSAQGNCTAFGSLGSSPGQFDTPAGVAIDNQNRILVTDRFNDRIQICTTQGSCTAFGASGSGLGQFNGPTGIAVDHLNRIVIVDRFNHRIQVCTHQGSCSAFGSFGQSAGQFDSPWGVAVDSRNRIIVADLGNNRIQIFSEPVFQINAGLNDAWFDPSTNGQGFFITVYPDIKQMYLAWFTFDTQRPAEDAGALLGDPGHRWLTALGPYDGDTANLTIYVTEGGVFDSPQPATSTDLDGDGSMIFEFADCTAALINYEITSLGISGEIPIQRVALDNVPLCEELEALTQ